MADIFGSEEGKWRAVCETVEGRQSPSSCVLIDGKISFSAKSVPKNAKPNLKFLSEILRSNEPLPPVAREWLASLFDPESASDYRVETLVRRPVGAKPAGRTHNWDAAKYALGLMRWGEDRREIKERGEKWETWKQAIFLTKTKFNLTKPAVERAIKSYRDALRESAD